MAAEKVRLLKVPFLTYEIVCHLHQVYTSFYYEQSFILLQIKECYGC